MKAQCPSGKRRFNSPRAAKARLGEIQANPDPTRLYAPNGVVDCPRCGGYHLTSASPKRWKKGKLARNRRV